MKNPFREIAAIARSMFTSKAQQHAEKTIPGMVEVKTEDVPCKKRSRVKIHRTERKDGAENACGEFLSVHDLRCLEICGCDLDKAFES